MASNPGPETLVVCPYDKSHVIRRCVLQTHLFKCSKNHGYKLVKCTFNTTHHVHPDKLKEHESQCPDRHSFDASFCKFSDDPSSTIPLEDIDLPAPADNWDDGQSGGYDPSNIDESNRFLFRGKRCVPPSERKAFMLDRREKAHQFASTYPLGPPDKDDPKPQLSYMPLRRPSIPPVNAKSCAGALAQSLQAIALKESSSKTAPVSQRTALVSTGEEVRMSTLNQCETKLSEHEGLQVKKIAMPETNVLKGAEGGQLGSSMSPLPSEEKAQAKGTAIVISERERSSFKGVGRGQVWAALGVSPPKHNPPSPVLHIGRGRGFICRSMEEH